MYCEEHTCVSDTSDPRTCSQEFVISLANLPNRPPEIVLTEFGVIHCQDHMGLVYQMALRHSPLMKRRCVEETQEFSDAMYGLYHAMARFDPYRGFKFSTYAYWCVKGFVVSGIKKRAKHKRLKSLTDADRFNVNNAPDLRFDVKKHREHEIDLQEILSLFPPNKSLIKYILEQYYLHGRILEDIGKELGVCKERVRQRITEALKFLRKQPKIKRLMDEENEEDEKRNKKGFPAICV
jgi:RNA polymerase sigma factor (sigma-70 family)